MSSELGVGLTFTVLLPFIDQSSNFIKDELEPIAIPQYTKEDELRPIVLYVEGDPAIMDSMKRLLKYENICAAHGGEALLHLSNSVKPSLVVPDYHLPNYNGIDVMRRVRKIIGHDLSYIIRTGKRQNVKSPTR